MAILLVCPNGHKSYVKDEHAGKKAACPICRAVVRVPDPRLTASPAPAPRPAPPPKLPIGLASNPVDEPVTVAPLDTDEDRPRKRGRRQALSRVHRGLGFHYARQIILLVGLLISLLQLILLGPKLLPTADAPREGSVRSFLFTAVGFLVLLLSEGRGVIGILGSAFCAAVPAKSGARGLIVASLVLDCLTLPLPLIVPFLDDLPGALLSLVGSVFGLVAWILFMLFLRKLAYYLDAEDCGDEAQHLLIKGLLMLIGLPVALIVAGIIALLTCCGGQGLGTFFFAIIALGIVTINYLFAVLELIDRVRSVIRPEPGA
jgi:hypothetical protein